MIRADKGGLFTGVLDWYIARKVRRAFRGVWVRGTLPGSEGGLLAYLNHSNFWDGFLVHQLAQVAGWNGFAMMDEANLAKYRFHTRIGAFSVRRDPKSALAMLRYTRELLGQKDGAVFIFPEGQLRAGQGPLGPLQRGVELIARTSGARCLPIAIRYAFLEHEHPDVLIEVGPSHPPGPLSVFEDGLSAAYARVLAALSTEGFTCVIRGRRSVQERWDSVRRLPPSSGTSLSPGAAER